MRRACFDIEGVVKSIGVEYVAAANAYDLEAAEGAMLKVLDFKGPSVVILMGDCMLQVLLRT